LKPFEHYLVAGSVVEAVKLRAEAGAGALFIAGGTTIVPAASRGIHTLIDITRLGLAGVKAEDSTIRLGATTRLSALAGPEVERALPMLYRAARGCATPLVRNMATVGGAVSGIFLPSDIGIPLLALGSKVKLQGGQSGTEALEDLLSGKWPPGDNLIIEVEVPVPGKRAGCGFAKFTRNSIDIGLVNVAVLIEVSEAGRIETLRIAVGQSASAPALIKAGETTGSGELLGLGELPGAGGLPVAGEILSEDLVRRIAGVVAEKVKAKSDSRASSEYRRHLIEILTARSMADAAGSIGVGFGD
jgi:CO/xanthine dehydrogenase FAD-binding subunit